jgi:hypothetical protein
VFGQAGGYAQKGPRLTPGDLWDVLAQD